jgi:CDP-paratose 2-epimerase
MSGAGPSQAAKAPPGGSAGHAVTSVGAHGSELLTLITGGAGFIGCNLAHRLLSSGRKVRILDNLSRPGVEHNLQWLRDQHGDRLQVVVADIRDEAAVAQAVAGTTQVFHFAAQVAVTTSLDQPREDFAINAQGTLNVLEAARARPRPPFVLMTSTNKVYGDLADLELQPSGQHYQPLDERIRARGVSEARPLDFHSPYGCSKGAADQYVLDHARSYGLQTMVFRMSCIYGPRQFGTEDQGWVAHFILRALRGEPITLYGDGRQVRDILFIDDLVDAFLLAEQNAQQLSGRVFNIGGGPANAISLLDLLDRIGQLQGRRPDTAFAAWRTGDQRYYVSDTRAFEQATGWRQAVGAQEGIGLLFDWLAAHRRPASKSAAAQRQPARVA